jgi:dTDP-4-dehydrorhamnose reductase
MKVIVLGSTSKTAYALYPKLISKVDSIKSYWFSSSEQPQWFKDSEWATIDYNDLDSISLKIKDLQPNVVINLAAYTNVDGCEDDKFGSHQINYELPKMLSELSEEISYRFIHISTDYIFDGQEGLYEIEDNPSVENIGWYALSKRDSEQEVLKHNGVVIRTNVLYDSGEYKESFLTWLKNKIKSNEEVSIVFDQFNNPTLTVDLAETIVKLIDSPLQGIIHTGGKDWMSRWELAQVYSLSLNLDTNLSLLKATNTSSLHQKSPRPKFGGLSIVKSENLLDMKFSGIYDFILENSELDKESIHFTLLQRLIKILRILSSDMKKKVFIDIDRNAHGTISIFITNTKIWSELEIGKSSYSGMLYTYDSTNLNLVTGDVYDDDGIIKFINALEVIS